MNYTTTSFCNNITAFIQQLTTHKWDMPLKVSEGENLETGKKQPLAKGSHNLELKAIKLTGPVPMVLVPQKLDYVIAA